ncbi:MAG TPA: AAA family ATPase [Solirubrobacterales bacterium]
MLTRLEVKGFKNLADLTVEFGPFTCIAGANGVGKSNIFDAIQFLSLLADLPLMEAAEAVRGTRDERTGDPRDLLWRGPSQKTMRFAAEMIVPPRVEDDFGQSVKPSISFLRYELEIGYSDPTQLDRRGRLVLMSESLKHINLGEAPAHLRFPLSAKEFRSNVVFGRRSGVAFISTRKEGNDRVITVHQDGGSRGQPRRASATRAPATVVSTITVADDPTVLAARREMQSWRRLALEPTALRTADRFTDPRIMSSDGSHLPATLYRIAQASDNGSHPDDVLARVASRLSELTGVSVKQLEIDADDTRELLTLRLVERSGVDIPARSLSEGTLRFLALCVLLEDPEFGGVVCMEEPENGIHPANIKAMLDLLQDLAVDPDEAPGPDNPVRQVIVNTHSPVVVQVINPRDLLFASGRPIEFEDGSIHSALELRPMRGSWRAEAKDARPIGKADLIPYLTTPAEQQLSLANS